MTLQKIYITGLLIYNALCLAQSGPMLLESTFEEFLREVVAQEDQKDFARDFQTIRKNFKKHFDPSTKKFVGTKRELEKMRQKITHLQEQGRIAMEVKDSALAADVKKTLCSKHPEPTQEKKIKTLWYRYGAYEEFLQKKAAKQKSIITKTKSYIRDAGNKIISWASTLRRSKVTA